MPMPSASPPSDMMFKETPIRFNGAKVISSDIGMLIPTISVGFRFRRKRNRMTMARQPPITAVLRTSLMLF